jgi:Ser/Thr protein kinase RdoA (MazF antagonist)
LPNSNDKINFAVAALKSWRGDENSLEPAADADSANYVFSFIESDRRRYLRLTPGGERTKNQIEAELDFIAFLHRGGVAAAQPVSSVAGRLIEEIDVAGNLLFACVFEEAEGERFRYDSAKFNKEHFRLRGRTLGQIHALSKIYAPRGDFRRFAWNEDKLLIEANKFLPGAEKIVWREFEILRQWLQDYPKSPDSFGLIHGDFGETNYLFQNRRLNVFDFDDCCYHWFLYDLAVTIYPHGWRKEGLQLLDWILEGYAEKMPLNAAPAEITMFCRWRLVYMFLVYARKWGFANLSAPQAAWFAQKRENIARGYLWQV